MAGDWIAFECATLEKPEVFKMARMLGVSKAEAILLLLKFWTWVDRNSTDGTCNALVTQDVDEMMHCQGFAAAMQAVDWLTIDDRKERITIPGFDIHHGKSAKKRLLANKRVATHRQRKGNAKSVTKELPQNRTEQNRELQKQEVASQPLSGKEPDDDRERLELNGHDDSKAKRGRALTADAKAILDFLNDKAGRKFPATDSNVGIIVARFKEGFTPTQVRQVIAIKVRKWKADEKMAEFLRPDTLFNRSKFSNYVGELADVPPEDDPQ